MRISDWSSDVCSSDLYALQARAHARRHDFQAALASWQAAAALYPDNDAERYLQVESRPAYGSALLRGGRVDEAVKVLQRIADDRRTRLGERHYDTAEARGFLAAALAKAGQRSEEHTSELQSLMRISYAGFCLKKKNNTTQQQ